MSGAASPVKSVSRAAIEESIEECYETAPCGYLSTLPDGTIIKANQTFLNWTGYSREDLSAGLRLQRFLSRAGQLFFETHLSPLLHLQGFINEIAVDIICKNGDRLPALLSSVLKRGDDGAPLLVRTTIFNATERRLYERELLAARRAAEAAAQELRRLNDTLEERVAREIQERMKTEAAFHQAQKMEALGLLTGGIVHDFKNLLTVVLGGLDRLGQQLSTLPSDPHIQRMRKTQELALQGAQRAAKLADQLLAFSRRQPLDPQRVEVNTLVAGMCDFIARAIGANVDLTTGLEPDVWPVKADPNQLESALLNLAVNARDAMPAGGRLRITTCNQIIQSPRPASAGETIAPGQYVCLTVADTGHGMDETTLSRVLEPFFTTKPPGRGSGLGLSQVYGFVRQTGGHMVIESEVGRGTSISLFLPRMVEAG